MLCFVVVTYIYIFYSCDTFSQIRQGWLHHWHWGSHVDDSEVMLKDMDKKSVPNHIKHLKAYFDGLVQDCSISIALAMEILQSCTKPSIWHMHLILEAYESYSGMCFSQPVVVVRASIWCNKKITIVTFTFSVCYIFPRCIPGAYRENI